MLKIIPPLVAHQRPILRSLIGTCEGHNHGLLGWRIGDSKVINIMQPEEVEKDVTNYLKEHRITGCIYEPRFTISIGSSHHEVTR